MSARSTRFAHLTVAALVIVAAAVAPAAARAQSRPKVGVALGGGSAKGIAHIGVLRWLEEHPAPALAGTSARG